MAITFRYVYDHDALMTDGNGEVKSCQANLVGRDESTGYEASITVRNKNCCALPHRGDAYVDIEDIDEDDCNCWCDHKLECEQPPEGFLTAREFYEDHITMIIKRDLAEKEALSSKTLSERRAMQAPSPAIRKSFMKEAP